jgi:ABC-type transporter Mla subunit MlaD
MSNHQGPTPRTDTKTLALAMRVLSHHIRSEDGVTNAALAEAADRLDEQADHIRRLVEAGDEIAFRLRESVFTEDEVAIEEWDHAKEAKP